MGGPLDSSHKVRWHRPRPALGGRTIRVASRVGALALVVAAGLAVAVGTPADATPHSVASPSAPARAPAARSTLPKATLPTASGAVDTRPASCPPVPNDPNTGSGTATQTGQFPWPAAPSGTPEDLWVADPHTPATAIPERPANWSQGGGDVKLTSARSGDTTLSDNPQELCGVEGNSVDTAWQTTTGRPSTVIAVTDSGIEWCDPALVDKIYLNRQALAAARERRRARPRPSSRPRDRRSPTPTPTTSTARGSSTSSSTPTIRGSPSPISARAQDGDGFGYIGHLPG